MELIVAALAVGAGTGASELATAGVRDAYTALRDALRRRLRGRDRAQQVLDAAETGNGRWLTDLGDDLTACGADRDEEVLAAARRLLELVDPVGSRAGKYRVDVHEATGVQVGDGNIHVTTNYGVTAGQMSGPVAIGYSLPPVPPAPPAAG